VKLWCADGRDCTAVVAEVFAATEPRHRVLALECLADAKLIDPELADRVMDHFFTWLGWGSRDREAIIRGFGAVAADSRPRGNKVLELLTDLARFPDVPGRASAFRALAASSRIEAAQVSARFRHQRLSFRLAAALDAAVPAGLEVLEAINVRVGPGKILIPDLAVVSTPGLDLMVCEAADVILIVEISSPGNAVIDRAVKPLLYAQAGIPHYLRVELYPAGPCAVVCRRERDRYVEMTRVDPGRPLVLTEPIPVTLDLTTLATTTRPPAGGPPSEAN
jgi:hypothetical protein